MRIWLPIAFLIAFFTDFTNASLHPFFQGATSEEQSQSNPFSPPNYFSLFLSIPLTAFNSLFAATNCEPVSDLSFDE